MKVREVMTSDVSYCLSNATLAEAAMIMWQRDCGVVPVIDEKKRVVGMITDRDICMALVTKNRLATDIKVSEVISGKVKSVAPGDETEDALKIMKKRQVRRLPVTSKDGVLLGIVSISDLFQTSKKGKDLKKKLLEAMREISAFRPPQLREIASENNPSSETANSDKADESAADFEEDENNAETPAAKDDLEPETGDAVDNSEIHEKSFDFNGQDEHRVKTTENQPG